MWRRPFPRLAPRSLAPWFVCTDGNEIHFPMATTLTQGAVGNSFRGQPLPKDCVVQITAIAPVANQLDGAPKRIK